VFVPDRFWGGIVGALAGCVAGAMLSGAIAQIAIGESVGETGLDTVLYAIPGTLLGAYVLYLVGSRQEPDYDPYEPPSGTRA
jgi:hypothetical protein